MAPGVFNPDEHYRTDSALVRGVVTFAEQRDPRADNVRYAAATFSRADAQLLGHAADRWQVVPRAQSTLVDLLLQGPHDLRGRAVLYRRLVDHVP